jgi:hypothetical protein
VFTLTFLTVLMFTYTVSDIIDKFLLLDTSRVRGLEGVCLYGNR